ncbi:hypothetical protein [Candidatus Bealeia paramacronuclearis]|uniref:hypothetical protein n=1 Tax=Candidatus Bealeia paramacronuclearis TaxID=1921001 RepID=UPI002F26CF75
MLLLTVAAALADVRISQNVYKLSLYEEHQTLKNRALQVTKVICPCHKEYIQPVESKTVILETPTMPLPENLWSHLMTF